MPLSMDIRSEATLSHALDLFFVGGAKRPTYSDRTDKLSTHPSDVPMKTEFTLATPRLWAAFLVSLSGTSIELMLTSHLVCCCSSLFCTQKGDQRSADALFVAVSQHSGDAWYVSTLQLQLVSTQLCLVCRSFSTLAVRVGEGTPRYLWVASAGRSSPTRVPPLRALGLKWETPGALPIKTSGVELAPRLQQLDLSSSPVVEHMVWPAGLKRLELSGRFNEPVDKVAWPASLQQLALGSQFNRRIAGVGWPVNLKGLIFGDAFNQSVSSVVFPLELELLKFGKSFNQPLDDVAFPISLKHLELGDRFNKRVNHVVWPSNVQTLVFGYCFNQSIAGIVWPLHLRELHFGVAFDQPLVGVKSPACLERLIFKSLSQPLHGVAWPASLKELSLGQLYNQPLDDVVWPDSLESLDLGDGFNQPIAGVIWPGLLRKLKFGFSFRQSLESVAWPRALRDLQGVDTKRWANHPSQR